MNPILKLWKKYSYIILLIFLVKGLFDFRIGLIAIICMLGPIIVSFFKGRFWCGNLCPRGSFYDNFIAKFCNKRKTPNFLRTIPFRIFITFLMLTFFTTNIIKNWGNLYRMGGIVYRLIVITTIIGLSLSLFYNERSWCNFCPMGNLAALISKIRNKKNKKTLLQIDANCISCRLCEKNCPMGLSPYKYKNSTIKHADCIQCGRCILKCPKKSIHYMKD
ncbi:4Fe-4S binding domain-containing protein [Clostridium cavendishii DSM 21758]|uniref:4Fe-4S binding domain-containing protein n=1 Tax=Clostridium cavendishii DSM 21758 TaxID=1121302 RepID=A0A1M6NIW6_9CLOT|nr:4Fe-4S binding protein [Clostridium cavendishii]SHJ95564.1 4Fe-4S binding domain-containing protein [Clostridium cavendishii DSM 21758]